MTVLSGRTTACFPAISHGRVLEPGFGDCPPRRASRPPRRTPWAYEAGVPDGKPTRPGRLECNVLMEHTA